MTVKAPPRFSDLVRTLSHACVRRRPPHAPRRMHQAVARVRPPRIPSESTVVLPQYKHSQEDYRLLEVGGSVVDATPLRVDEREVQKTVDALLVEYANRGDVQRFESMMSRASEPPTERQQDLHVKAHIVNASLSSHSPRRSAIQQFPTGALAVLHQYEASGHVTPIKSYTRVISALFNVQTCASSDPKLGRAGAQAHAWDLFAHMRYVAHPVPDAHLYALMIRACGSFSRPEPERALDLWTEMQENGVEPTKGAYEAIIRVCGRTGPEWLGEGMRLAREMSDRYSIEGMNGRGLWCALLEGCKRSGELKKARWILAEAVRGSSDDASRQDPMVDSELITHMFHTYASYKPPFSRGATRLVDDHSPSNEGVPTDETEEQLPEQSEIAEETRQRGLHADIPSENMENIPSFSRLPPQTSSEVIAETRALFDRILQDRSLSPEEPWSYHSSKDGLLVGIFARVELTPVLVNAYLSVFYSHASIETAQEAFESLFGESDSSSALGLQPDEHSYVNALERCAIARAEDRQVAARWAQDIWRRWEATEAKGMNDGTVSVGSFARLIEKAHAAMRRVLILSGDVDGALSLLRSFASRYPPNAVLRPTHPQQTCADTAPCLTPIKSTSIRLFAKPPILSTRTVLVNPETSTARPLVRLTSAASVKDDRVPPFIAFGDVDLLHTRLAEHGRTKDLGYIKWLCLAYSNTLKRRRDAALMAAPAMEEAE